MEATQVQTFDEIIGEIPKRFNVAEVHLQNMVQEYGKLKITGPDDREGYKAVREGRMLFKNTRGAIKDKGLELREDSNKFSKAVIAVEKSLIEIIKPTEDYLQEEEDRYVAEKERIKRETEEAEQRRVQARISSLYDLGMTFNGSVYSLGEQSINGLQIPVLDEKLWDDFISKVTGEAEKEKSRLAEIQRLKDEEEKRIAAERLEQENRMKALEEKEAAMKAESDRLEKEKAAIEEEKANREKVRLEQIFNDRAIKLIELGMLKSDDSFIYTNLMTVGFSTVRGYSDEEFNTILSTAVDKISTFKIEQEAKRQAEIDAAAERAATEERQKIEREAATKAEAERKAEESAKRKAARLPDKEKLLAFAKVVAETIIPAAKTEEGAKITAEIRNRISQLATFIEAQANSL